MFFMKKLLIVLFILAFVPNIESFAINKLKESRTLTRPWSVSSYGFLIFTSVQDLDEYITFAQTKTHAEMQQYIQDSLSGFSSLGSSIYSSSDVAVSATEAPNYAMNAYCIIQTDGIIMKPVSGRECSVSFEFILTLTPAYLNSTNYDNLKNGVFDSNSMNKFATDREDIGGISLSQFVSSTPYGHEDTQANDCPDGSLPVAKNILIKHNSLAQFDKHQFSGPNISEVFSLSMFAKNEEKGKTDNMKKDRPFWGWGQASCEERSCFNPVTNTWYTCYYYCEPSYYIFWINVHHGDCTYISAPCPPLN